MIGIVAVLKAQDGKGPQFEAVFRELAGKVRENESGNLLYQLTRSRADANTYKVMELYKDEDALAAHRQSEHMRELGPKMAPFMAGRPEVEYLDAVE